jgi:hypothetical protein
MDVLITGGYFDLATPYYQDIYEMRHLRFNRSMRRLTYNLHLKV